MKSSLIVFIALIIYGYLLINSQAWGREESVECRELQESLNAKCVVIGRKSCEDGLVKILASTCLDHPNEQIQLPAHGNLLNLQTINLYAEKSLALRPVFVQDSTQLLSPFSETEIYLAFRSHFIESISVHGFLNNHQTKTSLGTATNRKGRAEIEDFLFFGNEDLKLEEEYSSIKNASDYDKEEFILHFLRPKYAFLVAKEGSDIFKKSLSGRHYGDVYAVLKDEVKLRSTFTLRDSLNSKNKIMKGESPVYTFRQLFSAPVKREGEYFEAQIFGSLTSSDVKHFLVGCVDSRVYKSLGRKLKAAFPSIPVYRGRFKKDKNKNDVCRIVKQL